MKLNTKLFLLISILFFSLSHAQGKLNRAKNDLSKSNSSSSSLRSSWSSDDDDDDGEGLFANLFAEIADQIIMGIFIGDMESKYFFKYPYSDGSHGEYAFPDEVFKLKKSQFTISNTFFASGKEFYGNDIKLNFRFVPLVGVEVNHLHFFEDSPKNNLGTTSVMVNYYRFRQRYVTAFWGLGATYIGNDVDKVGFTYQVGIDVFLRKPYSINALWKQSFINSTTVNEFKLHAGYHVNRLSVHGGYNRYKLGSVHINALGVGLDCRF